MGEMIDKSSISLEFKAILNLIKIFIYQAIYLHIIACYWFMVL